MHATYFFLVDFPEGKPTTPAEVSSVFSDRFGSEYCDENNWYQEELFLWNDGSLIQLAEPGDWRGRDGVFEEWSAYPQAERWAKLQELAWRVLAYDLKVNNVNSLDLARGAREDELDKVSLEDLKKLIICEPAARLAAGYTELAERLKAGEIEGDHIETFLTDYHRRTVTGVYERFLSRQRDYQSTLPFLDRASPYDGARVMSLVQDSEDNKDHGIILVDIHT